MHTALLLIPVVKIFAKIFAKIFSCAEKLVDSTLKFTLFLLRRRRSLGSHPAGGDRPPSPGGARRPLLLALLQLLVSREEVPEPVLGGGAPNSDRLRREQGKLGSRRRRRWGLAARGRGGRRRRHGQRGSEADLPEDQLKGIFRGKSESRRVTINILARNLICLPFFSPYADSLAKPETKRERQRRQRHHVWMRVRQELRSRRGGASGGGRRVQQGQQPRHLW